MKSTVSPISTALAGAVAGTIVGVAATVALNDKNTKLKLKKAFSKVKMNSDKYLNNLKIQAKNNIKDNVAESLKDSSAS